jgi:hypothetical protein
MSDDYLSALMSIASEEDNADSIAYDSEQVKKKLATLTAFLIR